MQAGRLRSQGLGEFGDVIVVKVCGTPALPGARPLRDGLL